MNFEVCFCTLTYSMAVFVKIKFHHTGLININKSRAQLVNQDTAVGPS